jgi:hypothetical protein
MATGTDTERILGVDPAVLRIFRIFKLTTLSKYFGTDSIVLTLFYSLPSILSIGFVLLCVFFSYSILGVILFRDVRFGNYLTEQTNFHTFFQAMLTLFISVTGENWNGIMSDLMIQPPLCNPGQTIINPLTGLEQHLKGDCGYPTVAPIFYVSFTIISALLILNIFIAIVVNHYESQVEKQLAGPSEEERRKIAKRLRREKRQKRKFNNLHNIFDQVVDPIGDDDTLNTEIDEILGFDYSLLSNASVERFLKQWGVWRHAQIQVLWSNDQNTVIQEILNCAENRQKLADKNNQNIPRISPTNQNGQNIFSGPTQDVTGAAIQQGNDLIHYLYGALVYKGGYSSGTGKNDNNVSDYKNDPKSPKNNPKSPKNSPEQTIPNEKAKKVLKKAHDQSSFAYHDSKSLLDFEYTSWRDMFNQLYHPDDVITSLAVNPVWMHVSNIIIFLNWCDAPLGFRNDPLTPAETMRLLSTLNIRQYHGYVHVAEVSIALLQSLYGNEVLEISNINETALHNKQMLKKRYPQLQKLKKCTVNAGYYLCVIRAQRAIKRFLVRRAYEREKIALAAKLKQEQDPLNGVSSPPETAPSTNGNGDENGSNSNPNPVFSSKLKPSKHQHFKFDFGNPLPSTPESTFLPPALSPPTITPPQTTTPSLTQSLISSSPGVSGLDIPKSKKE